MVSGGVKAQGTAVALSVVSRETAGRTGELVVEALLLVGSNGVADYRLQLEPSPGLHLLNHWEGRSYAEMDQQVQAGDTIRLAFAVAYNPANVPHYLERLQLRAVRPDGTVATRGTAFVYFTPYNTVEVWSSHGLDQLNRVWDAPDYTWTPPPPEEIKPGNVPVCNLTEAELADENVPKKMKSVPGLAYAVPVRDDGTDDDSNESDAARARTWNGTISGRVDVPAINLNAVTGIRVEVWDKDDGLDDFLGSGSTTTAILASR
ncbi:hypothetical protein GCM10023186_43170 [Hymenobacter koreensis]|uniref:Uncharacterized protein n=1 Tax=Hymenobacter koreensis TaxID=1084523 RepID=A0ABP8JL80_9BACT